MIEAKEKEKCPFCDGGVGNMPSQKLFQEKFYHFKPMTMEMDVWQSEKESELLLTIGDSEYDIPAKYCPICGRSLLSDKEAADDEQREV